MNVEVLDQTQTEAALSGHRFGKSELLLSKIEESLMAVVDTEGSIFATDLRENNINSLRTRMYRRDVMITVRKVERGGVKGHVIKARTTRPDERG